MKHVSSVTGTFFLVSLAVLVQSPTAWSGDNGMQNNSQARRSSAAPKSLNEELAAMRAKVTKLEAALKEKHQGQTQSSMSKGKANQVVRGDGMSGTPQEGVARQSVAVQATPPKKEMKANGSMSGGMKGMKSGKKMGMGMMSAKGKKMGMVSGKKMGMGMMGGKGMGMMGRMPKMAGMAMPSALPGFPGASHIYHIGSTGFFLDHGEHITLSREQETKLNQFKEKSLLKQATFTRQIEEAEQNLWVLTSSDTPDIAKIDAQVRKIAKLQGDQRIAFIRAVGEAAKVLTNEQRKKLVGQHGGELNGNG